MRGVMPGTGFSWSWRCGALSGLGRVGSGAMIESTPGKQCKGVWITLDSSDLSFAASEVPLQCMSKSSRACDNILGLFGASGTSRLAELSIDWKDIAAKHIFRYQTDT